MPAGRTLDGERAAGRTLGAQVVARTGIAVFLASRASSYITGAVIPVDGGISVIR